MTSGKCAEKQMLPYAITMALSAPPLLSGQCASTRLCRPVSLVCHWLLGSSGRLSLRNDSILTCALERDDAYAYLTLNQTPPAPRWVLLHRSVQPAQQVLVQVRDLEASGRVHELAFVQGKPPFPSQARSCNVFHSAHSRLRSAECRKTTDMANFPKGCQRVIDDCLIHGS